MPSLLFVFAHPDDESFSGAGTAMKYAEAGAQVVLVTATLGQRGKRGDPPVCEPHELEHVRERELREAAAIIGFHELHLLGYQDRAFAEAPHEQVRESLVTIIRNVRPAVVFTFDPNGFNVHPDHVAISRFTSDAIAAAADPRWHPETGAPHRVPRLLWTPTIPPWEAAKLDDLTARPGADFVIDVAAYADRRVAALRAHRTQHLSIDRYFFNQPDLEEILAKELWRQGFGPDTPRPSGDVLHGLSTDSTPAPVPPRRVRLRR
jgi:LmbE family N-acetylglucosaminyl deacetylase